MKFLLHGNGPNVSTGYGVQIRYLVERLASRGDDVAVSCTYGQQGSTSHWRDVLLYPNGYEVNGNDIIHGHAMHHFGNDELGGWIVTLLDVWALVNPLLRDFNVASWTPVDHFPAPPAVLEYFARTDAVPVAMSRYGERLLFEAGLDPVYIPLAVDTKVMKPTPTIDTPDGVRTARELLGLPNDAFVVGMVAMNKGWARDRKGFNEAFRAFGAFWREHPEAVLYMHAENLGGAEGINHDELAQHCAIPPHAIRWCDQYAYRLGVPQEMMALTYTAMDVLLAPSHGEGFCVPLIEAQACGVPVIATDFSSQTELVGAGWLVTGQPEWDAAQHASYVVPYVGDVVKALESAHAADLPSMIPQAMEFAARYDADVVFTNYWQPFLASLEPTEPPAPPYKRDPMFYEPDQVAVIVPAMRPDNMLRVYQSFAATTDRSARLFVVADVADAERIPADLYLDIGGPSTFAQKVNAGYAATSEPWVLLVGDDVEFKPGWLDEARKLSDRFDVIGTNDTSGEEKNPDVAAGRHSDHSFFRRAYVDAVGACLDGPGALAPEAYRHWYCDKEQVGLARARGVFAPCLASIVEHHHPGYDGREDLRQADAVYMAAVGSADEDAATYRSRAALIEMQRVSRAKVR